MKASKAKIENELRTLEKTHVQVCSEIDSNFDNIMAAVKERKSVLLSDAAQLRASKVDLPPHVL
jgi:outer membrane protein TolC